MSYFVVEHAPFQAPFPEEVYKFDEEQEAIEYAVSLAAELEYAGFYVGGDPETGFYATQESNDYGRIIEIIPIDFPYIVTRK